MADAQSTPSIGIGGVDVVVMLAYLGLLAVVAWRCRPRGETGTDYFLGGRSLPAWAVALSFMATAMSAATFVGAPQEGFTNGFQLLSWQISGVIAIGVVAFLFIPAFYRSGVSTVYGLLEVKVGRGARIAAGITFLLGRVLASGARLYVAGLAIGYLLYPVEGHTLTIVLSVIVVTAIAVGYVWFGGIRSVVWTDVCQAGLFVVASVVSIIALLVVIPLPFGEVLGLLGGDDLGGSGMSRLSPINANLTEFGFDQGFSLPALVFGFSLLFLGAYGTDQDLAQRLLTCRDRRSGVRSALLAVGFAIPMTFIFLCVGQLLWVLYANPDLMGAAAPPAQSHSAYVYLDFVLDLLPPGIAGLIAAGVLAAAISSLTSELNALASSFVGDCWQPITGDRDDVRALQIGRRVIPLAACALAGTAVACIAWHAADNDGLIAFAMKVMVFAYSGLVGVFLCVLLTKRGSDLSVIAALVVGFVVTLWTRYGFIADHVAWTWGMLIATTAAFVVCACGRRPVAVAE